MSAAPTLTAELRTEVLALEADLRARVSTLADVHGRWRAEYDAAREAERTAAGWEAWVDERVTLAAVAWVLTTVFVRFCEDNELVRPVWIGGARAAEAVEAQEHFLRETARINPDVTDREWLLEAVHHLERLPATAGLVDPTSPMWLVSPSGDAATRLLAYWRAVDETGSLLRDLSDPDLDTRFLGDLYQDVSEDAKKRYALLQTPEFVEEFILEYTLEPALNERPLEGFRMIDPTCGSGHFLLGGFRRLLDRWHRHAPAFDERERVQRALDAVYGVDINPFAVAIARFRLTVAALQACELTSLEEAPAFNYHLAAGDSLLGQYGAQELNLGFESAPSTIRTFTYSTEDRQTLGWILQNGQYDCVVGNPPYIAVKDRALNDLYRRTYNYCKGKYALTAPFMEKFFSLAKTGVTPGRVGQITSNSFTKRAFGQPLVEEFLPSRDVTLIIDTSGAYIPGHNTPTVMLTARNSRPASARVRAVLGVTGETGVPSDPADAPVWRAIVAAVDAGISSPQVSSVELDRELLAKHPWSLSGGGVVELLQQLEKIQLRLEDVAQTNIFSVSGEDDVLLRDLPLTGSMRRTRTTPVVHGEAVRDWKCAPTRAGLLGLSPLEAESILWPWRRTMEAGAFFGRTRQERGLEWYDFAYLQRDLQNAGLLISWAEVTTHNHFTLLPPSTIANQTAPVARLRKQASKLEHITLLGALNSSTACFWLKQACYPKGGDPVGTGGARVTGEPWEDRYAFNSSNVQRIPLPSGLEQLAVQASRLAEGAFALTASRPSAICGEGPPTRIGLRDAGERYHSALARMVSAQEELDWETYHLYGLIEDSLSAADVEVPELAPGERAFEIVVARRLAAGEEATAWFERHSSTPITELPTHWPNDYRQLVERRIALIESHPFIRLLERPEYKRRWATEPWAKQEERALREWLLDRLEDPRFWFDRQGRPTPRSVSALADEVARDSDLSSVLALWEGRPDVAVAASLERLLAPVAVPFLSAYRFKDTGLRKRADWERTWSLQRREDAGTYDRRPVRYGGEGPIPVPPKYAPADFRRPEYWANRGKLDVPKERFTLYPGAGRDGDPSPVVGWAGWDFAQQSLALASLVGLGEEQGWPVARLVPLVAGLAELLPWVEQRHAGPEPLYGGSSPTAFFSELLDSHMTSTGTTRAALAAWRPPAATRGRKASR